MAGDDSENGQYKTFIGAGFGTLMIQHSGGSRSTPEVASNRGYLRNGLPSIYSEEDFGMRFLAGLEEVLDPIIAVLDALPAHFDPDLAPRHILSLLSGWLGVDFDESQAISGRREKVRRAADLGRTRGTLRGLQLALDLSFPGLPLRVEDEGGVTFSTDVDSKLEAKPAQFIVYCDRPIPSEKQAAVARCIEQIKPIHTSYRLRVKAPKKKPPAEPKS